MAETGCRVRSPFKQTDEGRLSDLLPRRARTTKMKFENVLGSLDWLCAEMRNRPDAAACSEKVSAVYIVTLLKITTIPTLAKAK